MAINASLCITRNDYSRLRALIVDLERHARSMQAGAETLEEILDTARVVQPEQIPGSIVTMNSTVEFVDVSTGDRETVTVVYPEEANVSEGRISVLSPVGTALLGLPQGNDAELPLPHGRTRRIRIEAVLYQPEAEGHYAL
jgi:regulator of nucleoside diphosphate kinase